MITTIAEENRLSVSIEDVPVSMQQAIVAIEDADFWEHNGVNPKAIARAADANAESGSVSQGGSTITQQYVKNALLDDDRTIARKVEEATMAMAIERAYSKEVILENYLNTIYFGSGAYGVEAASLEYFGVPTTELTLPQAAMLAGAVQSPSKWDPRRNPEATVTRRNLVLQRMQEEGYISAEQRLAAAAEPLVVLPDTNPEAVPVRYPAAHFVEEVKQWLLSESDALGDNQAERYDNLLRGGLTITTTIDLDLQTDAEAAIAKVLPKQGENPKMPDAALTSIEPRTGFVKAMVGGRDFWGGHPYAKLNLAEGAGRSTGSAFKPIALATALANGVSPTKRFNAPSAASFRTPGDLEREGWGDRFGNPGAMHGGVLEHLLRRDHPRRRRRGRSDRRDGAEAGHHTDRARRRARCGAGSQQRDRARHGIGVRHVRQRRDPRAAGVRDQGRTLRRNRALRAPAHPDQGPGARGWHAR
ncbi:MAG: transglycosylase domain-containing protein [Microthrixaceae bacterium]|nr:transglycosylase domain-containing protein [Microthrixaceae bacterium]